jgi:hypothetical protein
MQLYNQILATYQTAKAPIPTWADGVFPIHNSATISAEFSKINARKPEYKVYEIFRALASASGGFLSFDQLRLICVQYGARYQTVLKYLKRCSDHGWITRYEYGYRWVSEENLYVQLVKPGSSRMRLGAFPLSIAVDELLPYLSKGVGSFRELLAKKRDILGEGKKQQQIIQSTKKIIEKISSGKKVYKRGVDPHDGTPYRMVVTLEEARRTLWYYTENTVGPSAPHKPANTGEQGNSDFNGNYPYSSKTRCLTNCRTLSCTSAGGEAAYTLKSDNTTTIWSKQPVTKQDLFFVNKFREQSVPEDFDSTTWYKTEIVESCLSQSSMSRLNSMSAATNGRYARKLAQCEDVLVVKQLLVVGKYDPKLTRELNDLDASGKFNTPVKGKYYAIRMSKSKLFKLQKQGVIVDWANIDGTNEEMYKAKEFTVQVFQHRYFVISKSKVQGPSEVTGLTGVTEEPNLLKNDSVTAQLQHQDQVA